MGEDKLVAVYRAGNSIEGNFVQSLLVEEGIPVKLRPNSSSGRRGDNGEVEVQVPAERFDAAKRVIDRYEAGLSSDEGADTRPWNCRRCGEENEASFESCWNCQAESGHA